MKISEIKKIKGDTSYEKERKRKIEKSKLICDHKYENNKGIDAAVNPTRPNSSELECEICHRKFDAAPISKDDQKVAIETIKRMYDCVKLSIDLTPKQREDISNAILLVEGLPVAYQQKFINRRTEPEFVEERVSNSPMYLDKMGSRRRRSEDRMPRRRRNDDYDYGYEDYDDEDDRYERGRKRRKGGFKFD